MADFVTYLRVSTGRQQQSGLGLDAQREAVHRHADRTGGAILAEYVEVESGRKANRPELERALAHCRHTKSTLLIARLDRLARNVAFVATLMETGVEFVAVDAPFANRLMIHVLSAVAEFEREQISERTKAALAAAKARGVELGKQGKILAAQNRAEAQQRAEALRPWVERAKASGCRSLADYGKFLTDNDCPTQNGGRWHPMSVKRVLDRLG
ncbi:MAG: recombinase family protein [Novosphingobium sp.]|nr:recombinase family protein [Novosphingobium sp.]MCP5401718.1 recombinase family protein [Novosphingobium sp.]